MINKKTLVLAVGISWALTLVTVLLISNFAPSLTQPFSEQLVSLQSVKVVNLQKPEVMNMQDMGGAYILNLNFSWSPSNPNNNAILGIVGSFEYSINTQLLQNPYLGYVLRVHGFEGFESDSTKDMRIDNTNGEWELTSFKVLSRAATWITPNQSEYPITLMLIAYNNQTHIRNVNLMLLVIDG